MDWWTNQYTDWPTDQPTSTPTDRQLITRLFDSQTDRLNNGWTDRLKNWHNDKYIKLISHLKMLQSSNFWMIILDVQNMHQYLFPNIMILNNK